MAQVNINIRMDETVKKQAEELFNELGLNMTTAFNMFVRQALNRGGIPFEVVRKDAFYSPYNQEKLRESIASTDKTVKSLDALEKLAQ
ncbi:type II toxin-antitoxin system RelB/DinJ family antitoxin [Sulfurospirillum barnesii]|uniref:Addiction module antitoxin, RelB/DinJ family n=1 Tax=Sulfurospirillum barnesii (strain ATCC 700032 / DSM 10660 / SES-3) TaxID=760154 RepID=I3XY31_SULBS|nr:type II toxin-antitoxin system RelB/DinJ family antitoxin [Sulfurospirillum barnesii]AFL68855.1 addiction module antitoxin, RelB/DinJ family [Sulfurospirillum barnesii SES-3]